MQPFNPTGLGEKIWKERYAYPGEQSWSDTARRVAVHVAKAETNGNVEPWTDTFYDIINSGLFFPGGRIIYGSGRKTGMMMNCFVLGVDDSRESIGELYRDFFVVSATGGGVGINWSNLRPMGGKLSSGGVASGPCSFIDVINSESETVRLGGGRRAAVLSAISVHHPDLLVFMNKKLDLNNWQHMNVSVMIDKQFIEAVEKDEPWVFTFGGRVYNRYRVIRNGTEELFVCGYDTDSVMHTCINYYRPSMTDTFEIQGVENISARVIWEKICANALLSGEPGILNEHLFNKMNPTYYDSPIVCTNPCAELGLQRNTSCCLGSLNLPMFVRPRANTLDWNKLRVVVGHAVRFLDDVLDVNEYPLGKIKESTQKHRRIGLGIMGFATLCGRMGIEYGSPDCIEFAEDLMYKLRNFAYEASVNLAKEKAPFPVFDRLKYIKGNFIKQLPSRLIHDIYDYGIRNCAILSIAPTGTLSMVAGCSSGIEPVFAPVYKRRYRVDNTLAETVVIDPLVAELYMNGQDPRNVKGAYDVTPEQHIAVQAAFQKYVCNSISKTINVPASMTDPKDLSDVLLRYARDLKGVTVYRAGSRGEEPLSPIPWSEIPDIETFMKENLAVEGVEGKCKSGVCEI